MDKKHVANLGSYSSFVSLSGNLEHSFSLQDQCSDPGKKLNFVVPKHLCFQALLLTGMVCR